MASTVANHRLHEFRDRLEIGLTASSLQGLNMTNEMRPKQVSELYRSTTCSTVCMLCLHANDNYSMHYYTCLFCSSLHMHAPIIFSFTLLGIEIYSLHFVVCG